MENNYDAVTNKIEELIKSKNLEEALKICLEDEYKDVAKIQSQALYIYTQLNDFDSAYELFEKVKHIKESFIQSKGLKILRKLGKFDELKALVSENNNIPGIHDISYDIDLVRYYQAINDYETAMNIASQPKYNLESTFINLRSKLKKSREYYQQFLIKDTIKRIDLKSDITIDEIDNMYLRYFIKDVLKIAFYDRMNSKNRAINYLNTIKGNYIDNLIQSKELNDILNYLRHENKFNVLLYCNVLAVKHDWEKAIEVEEEKIEDIVSVTLGKIFADVISIDEIDSLEIEKPFEKEILKLAYYEKNNKQKGIALSKQMKKYLNDYNEIKINNKIYSRLSTNKFIKFDPAFYSNLLHRKFNYEDAFMIMDEKKNKEDFKKIIESVSKEKEKQTIKVDNIANNETIEKTKKVERKMVGSVGINVNNRYSNNSNINTPIHTPTKTVPCIKDVLGDEIDSLQKYLYCLMQDYSYYIDANDTWKQVSDVACKLITKRSPYTEPEKELLKQSFNKMKSDYDYYKRVVKAWDNVEILSTKPISDRKALSRIINVLLKVNERHPEIIEADTSKLVKLLNK